MRKAKIGSPPPVRRSDVGFVVASTTGEGDGILLLEASGNGELAEKAHAVCIRYSSVAVFIRFIVFGGFAFAVSVHQQQTRPLRHACVRCG